MNVKLEGTRRMEEKQGQMTDSIVCDAKEFLSPVYQPHGMEGGWIPPTNILLNSGLKILRPLAVRIVFLTGFSSSWERNHQQRRSDPS